MAQLVVLPDEEFKKIVNRIGGSGITVLMPKSLADKHGLEEGDDRLLDYDTGGDADLWVDIAGHENHYVFSWLESQEES